jgi:DNA-binding NarL/FixJ family response regulator
VSSAAASPPDGRPLIKVLLADDEGLVRSGFKVLLDLEDDITVVGEATTGAEAVERARACRPDVILMDIRMPQLEGLTGMGAPSIVIAPSPTRRVQVR